MKKIFFIALVLIPLITGCNNKMDELKKHITHLSQSTDRATEKNNATDLNAFSISNHISYNLIISKNNKSINISDLDKNINENLKVSIEAGKSSETWMPIDNNNIYILLRE